MLSWVHVCVGVGVGVGIGVALCVRIVRVLRCAVLFVC